ncbi:Aspartic protease, partial [Rasamsonia emersonii CBS 393.64]
RSPTPPRHTLEVKVIRLRWESCPLGAPRYNTSYTENDGRPPLNTTFINSYLYTNGGGKAIPSYSYGLHIGSAALNIPGSLFLGGYDQSRALEPVSAQPYTSAEPGGSFAIELLDIEIGVATGGSPWNFTNKTGLLIQGDSPSLKSADITRDVFSC